MPKGETLYDAILGRVASAHREGRVNTARNLLRYLTVGANGPRLPGVSVRVFRRKLRQMGLFFGEKKKGLDGGEAKAVYSEMEGELLQEAGCPARRRKT